MRWRTIQHIATLSATAAFSWARDGTSIHVRSDEPIPETASAVIALAETRLRRSPLFDPTRTYPMYVCNARWRWNYLRLRRPDPYWKYLLLVTHLLDREGLAVKTVLNDPPDAHAVEARVRASGTDR